MLLLLLFNSVLFYIELIISSIILIYLYLIIYLY